MKECFKCGSDKVFERHEEIFECSECSARHAHGEPMPRIIVQPHQHEGGSADERFNVITFQYADGSDHQVVLDRRLAKLLAMNLDSIS